MDKELGCRKNVHTLAKAFGLKGKINFSLMKKTNIYQICYDTEKYEISRSTRNSRLVELQGEALKAKTLSILYCIHLKLDTLDIHLAYFNHVFFAFFISKKAVSWTEFIFYD